YSQMTQFDSQETDSQWMRRLGAASESDESQDSFFNEGTTKRMKVWPANKFTQIRKESQAKKMEDEEKKKMMENEEKERGEREREKVEEKKTREDEETEKENRVSTTSDDQSISRVDTEDEMEVEDQPKGDEDETEVEMEEGGSSDSQESAEKRKEASQRPSVVGDSQEKSGEEGEKEEEEEEVEKVDGGEGGIEKEKEKTGEKDPDEPQLKMEKETHELTRRMEAILDLRGEIRALIRSQFDMLLGMTTPETPADVWLNLLSNYAANEEEIKKGEEFVRNEHPSGKKTEGEKISSHRNLSRMVVSRLMQKEMRSLSSLRREIVVDSRPAPTGTALSQ
ncbi:hypothetical protein PFISCL1PPCAC_24846, partial [Pristionchus fissidentatus]